MRDEWILIAVEMFQEIARAKAVLKTDTGGQVENTKALERTMLKELGKILA